MLIELNKAASGIAPKFEIGDLVCLKSNPQIKMTVVSVEDGNASVRFFDKREHLINDKFHQDCLIKFIPEKVTGKKKGTRAGTGSKQPKI